MMLGEEVGQGHCKQTRAAGKHARPQRGTATTACGDDCGDGVQMEGTGCGTTMKGTDLCSGTKETRAKERVGKHKTEKPMSHDSNPGPVQNHHSPSQPINFSIMLYFAKK